ncbi:hypothetical protein PCANC_09571 [Puccinia coronata f. sp. avenae]|uniref:Reverse transcriptase Ty1/copia-type domain-containing protein n=1 Tax=Puccinia coronata f. sp. avenae TaxID=200324 RepID=A0A2N5V9T4_9BASI|nr:hypothetical protein PCANC_09571 [Puccinia coronata f. sp. avenae]
MLPSAKKSTSKIQKESNKTHPNSKLCKALYGLKKAPKNWYKTLISWLESIGFHESSCDPCLYLCDDKISWIFLHVNNLVLVGPGNDFKIKFEKRFYNSVSHKPNTVLGMKFERIGHKIWGLIAARLKGVRTPMRTPKKKTACSRCTPLRKGAQRLHALPRRLHAICTPSIDVRPCQTGVQSLHACLEGVQSLHALWTGVQALHACRLTNPPPSSTTQIRKQMTGHARQTLTRPNHQGKPPQAPF